MRPRSIFGILVLVALTGAVGYWLAGSAVRDEFGKRKIVFRPASEKPPVQEPMPEFRRRVRPPAEWVDGDAAQAGALQGQRVLVFKDQQSLADFLRWTDGRIRVLGRLDALNALRIGFSKDDDLVSLLDGSEEMSFIFPVEVPSPTEGTVQAGAIALGDRLLSWLGIEGDNSAWGNGVKIAVLDTGVSPHPSFSGKIVSLNLVEMAADPANWNGHGTAVASMIIGNDPNTPGVAPGAETISVRIANDRGQSDSFLLAQGIVAAVDAGVQLINISMGSTGDSALVRNAIEYARNAGALIIAAAGNNGSTRLSYPAANEGVLSVGAVDGAGNHMAFSNTGDSLGFSAPGYGVNAAWTGNEAVRVDGTSFSSPITTGALAAIMTHSGYGRITPGEALNLLYKYANDAGSADSDAVYGRGFPALDRVMNAKTPGIYDAALASHVVLAPDDGTPYARVGVLVQNRGTETLVNIGVETTSPSGTVVSNISSLQPNAVQTIYVPISQENYTSGNALQFDSRIVPSRYKDAKPSNNRRVETYTPAIR